MIMKTPPDSIVLDIAPTKSLTESLRNDHRDRYVGIDFDPAADGRVVDIQATLTQLPFRSGSVGFLLCSHVLEHVPDDLAAMYEIARVLAPSSMALIQVPRKIGMPTDEDPTASADERKTRFGQADHVRYYGDDFESRLEDAALRVEATRFSTFLPPHLLRLIGAHDDEELWLATKDRDPLDFYDMRDGIDALALSLASAASDLDAALSSAQAEAETWRSRYEWLKNRPLVRLGSAGKRILKNAARGLRS